VISRFALLCEKTDLCYELQNYVVVFLFSRKIKGYKGRVLISAMTGFMTLTCFRYIYLCPMAAIFVA